MTSPPFSLQELLAAVALLVPHIAVATLLLRRLGLTPSSIDALAVGVAQLIGVGCVLTLLARAASSLGLGTMPLELLYGALLALPLAVLAAHQAAGGGRPAARAAARWCLPGATLVVAATVAVCVAGQVATFGTDSSYRADAVKEMVWSNSSNAAGSEPDLADENVKYASYLGVRAAVTNAGGGNPLRPSLAWLIIAASGLAAAVWTLAAALGLGPVGAGAALIACFLFGGDAYRLSTVGDPRPVATLVLLTGAGLLAAAMRRNAALRTDWPLYAVAGLLVGAAGLVHLQYNVIAGSILAPLVIVAGLVSLTRRHRTLRPVAIGLMVACLAAGPPILASLSAGRGLVSDTSLSSAAAEREEGAGVVGKDLLQSGRWVFPPETVALNDYRMLYAGPDLYMLHPKRVTKSVWGERASPLLAIVGLTAALLLAAGIGPALALVIGASLAAPVLILLNPVAFPLFDRLFSVQRSEYIGFEFAFVAAAAVVALVLRRPRLGIPLAIVAAVAAVPIVRTTNRWYTTLDRVAAYNERTTPIRSFSRVQDATRHRDRIVVPRDLLLESDALVQRTVEEAKAGRFPDPFSPRSRLAAVAADLSLKIREHGRVIAVFDPRCVAADAPIRRLLASGRTRALPADGAGAPGLYWLAVDAGRPCGQLQDLPREA